MLSVSPDLGAFISAPIKLAALISGQRRHAKQENQKQQVGAPIGSPRRLSAQKSNSSNPTSSSSGAHLTQSSASLLLLLLLLLTWAPRDHEASQLLPGKGDHQHQRNQQHLARHQAHYLDIAPSAHFRYAEGRQLSAKASEQQAADLEARSASGGVKEPAAAGEQVVSSHIYKRSSALISSPSSHYPQLVSSSITGKQNPLSRRMMAEAAQHSRWTAPQMMISNGEQQVAEESQPQAQVMELMTQALDGGELGGVGGGVSESVKPKPTKRRPQEEEAELLRQKQHIQYHDQWPSMAGKCHKRTLNFCASVLPFNTTTFPNIIGDTNRFEVKRSLPFFGFLAKSSCNKRLDELLCLLLEPPCSASSGLALPPCKKFCRLALEGCNEYIPATLAMSSVFDCRQYPDSNDPAVCINLAQGSKCADDEFKCPDKTCIPRNWLCDGVRDCIFAADEANCTALSGVGQQTSVCSTEEFKCDGKCVPKAWKCDGERDCLDGSDEEACDQKPRCGPDRFRCADGNGCLPKRWVCDGKAECRDGSDELNCELRECSENDFKCDNGICIPKLWRCDRQPDCKDASDERHCIYTNLTLPGTTASPTSPATEAAPTTRQQQAVDAPAGLSISNHYAVDSSAQVSANYYAGGDSAPVQQQQQVARQQLESSLNDDISRIIQQESSSSPAPALPSSPSLPDMSTADTQQQLAIQVTDIPVAATATNQLQQRQSSKELKKFDYDIIQSAPNLIQMNDLSGEPIANQQQVRQQQKSPVSQQQQQTQIDFVPQQQVRQLDTGNQLANQQRERTFGQVIKTKGNTGEPVELPHQQQQQQQQQQIQQHRVPIYRSLFKTLKSGQARLIAAQNGDHRYTMAVRRRRERHQVASTSQAPLISEEPSRVVMWTSAAPDVSSSPTAPPQQQVQAVNQTTPLSARNHGVASYLQLLNSRYNLRLARVSPLPPARS